MNIAVMVSGSTPPRLRSSFGGYSEMIAEMLGPGFSVREFDVRLGRYPPPCESSAYVIAGSPASVRDAEPWIPEVMDWIRRSVGQKPMLGICFGHQLMAEAFGGRVEHAGKGWGMGLDHYRLNPAAAWLSGEEAVEVDLPITHGEQVLRLPKGAQVLGGSAFCPNGVLAYPGYNALSLQPHPDFHPLFAEALIETDADAVHPADAAERALASLRGPNDNARVAAWLARFLAKGLPKRR